MNGGGEILIDEEALVASRFTQNDIQLFFSLAARSFLRQQGLWHCCFYFAANAIKRGWLYGLWRYLTFQK